MVPLIFENTLKGYGISDADIRNLWNIISSGRMSYRGPNNLSDIKDSIQEINENFAHTKDIIDEIRESQKEVNKLQEELNNLTVGSDEYKDKELELTKATLELRTKEQERTINGYNYLDRVSANWDNRTKQLKKGVNEIRDSVKKIGDSVNKILGPWTKMSQTAADYAKNIGLSGRGMDKLRKLTIDSVANRGIGWKYNTSVEELIKLQQSYTNTTGRQIRLSGENYENVAATSRILGNEGATELLAKFENFGLGIDDASARVGKMFALASKSGISLDKLSKNVKDNINIAQKYNFRNGLRGLESMAKKATEIGLNMSQAASFAEKVNTVEGAVTTGAQLQVLGGPFARMADPIGMLYESLNDMEGLQDRMTQMFGNLGTFNRQTGEVELSAFNKVRIREAAKSMGIDENNIFESINNQARRNEIANQLSGNTNVSKETAELIKNIGVIKNGVAGVNINGNFVEASKITNKDTQYLEEIARSESDDVKDIAIRLRGWEDHIQGFTKQKDAVHGQLVESMNIGKGLQKLITDVSDMKGLLQGLALGAITLGGIGIVGGVGGMIKGGSHVIGGTGNVFRKSPVGTLPTLQRGVSENTAYVADVKGNRLGTRVYDKATGKIMSSTGVYKGGGGLKGGLIRGRSNMLAYNASKLGKGLNIAGIAGAGLSIGTDLWVSANKNRRGGFGDYAGNMLGDAASYGALGAQIGSAIAPGIGTAIVGGIGAALGMTSGAIKATKNARYRDIEGLSGLELNGRYSSRELKQIREALKGNGTVSEKLMEKMKSRGDFEMLNKLDEISKSIITPDGTVRTTVVGAQKKATGGIVTGSSTQGDQNVVMTNAREMVLNLDQQSKLFSAISSGNFKDIASKDTKMVEPIKIEPRQIEASVTAPVPRIEKPSKVELTGSWNINLNVNGAIKEEGANGVGKDLNIDTRMLEKMIEQTFAKKISEELSRMETGGRLIPGKGFQYA